MWVLRSSKACALTSTSALLVLALDTRQARPMAMGTSTRRSTTTKDRHRKRNPPRGCAACGEHGVRLYQDHIVNLAAGGEDHPSNMQWLCGPCHHVKSERERLIGLRAFNAKKYREPERHPGALS